MSSMVRLTGPRRAFYSGPMTGTDFLQLSPAAAPVRGLTGWLADAIRAAIMDGRLRAGAPLPASRLLAGDLGVSRGVIVEAYQRLADEGLVSARPGAGTRVLGVSRAAPGPVRADLPDPALRPLLVPAHWRERAEIDLSPGVPDLSGFPRAAWLRAERLVLEQASVAELGYGDPRGSQPLRTELAGWLARTRGLRAGPGDIIVVTGVAQALALLARVLRARGMSEIAVEDPGSRGARDDLAYWGLRPVPALHASAPGLVAYAGSTSKTLAPGMRLGWLIPPGWLHADLVEAKYASDLGSPALPQLVLAHLIACGDLEQHIRLVRSGSGA